MLHALARRLQRASCNVDEKLGLAALKSLGWSFSKPCRPELPTALAAGKAVATFPGAKASRSISGLGHAGVPLARPTLKGWHRQKRVPDERGPDCCHNRITIKDENNTMSTNSITSDRTSKAAKSTDAAGTGHRLPIFKALLWLALPLTLAVGCASTPNRSVANADFQSPAIDHQGGNFQ